MNSFKHMKSGGSSPLFTKQTSKITLRTLYFTKNQSTQKVQKSDLQNTSLNTLIYCTLFQ